jgi:DJ-1/PfpI family
VLKHISSLLGEAVRSWEFTEAGENFAVDVVLDRARPRDSDALRLLGGVMNADALRMQPKAVDFVKTFFDDHKPVAVICHAPGPLLRLVRLAGRGSPRRRRSRLIFGTRARSGLKAFVNALVLLEIPPRRQRGQH